MQQNEKKRRYDCVVCLYRVNRTVFRFCSNLAELQICCDVIAKMKLPVVHAANLTKYNYCEGIHTPVPLILMYIVYNSESSTITPQGRMAASIPSNFKMIQELMK